MSEDKAEEEDRSEERASRPGLRGLARRIFESDREDDEHTDESRTRDRLIAVLATGDKAKTEIVRMLAREVRSYLEALELHKDLHYLLTNYSLEVQASFSLKPKPKPKLKPKLKPKPETEPSSESDVQPSNLEKGDE